jgi:hypothetical protein
MEKKYFVIYSLRIANALARKGFQIVDSRVNYKNPQYMVYMFEDTPQLQSAIKNLTAKPQ